MILYNILMNVINVRYAFRLILYQMLCLHQFWQLSYLNLIRLNLSDVCNIWVGLCDVYWIEFLFVHK